jgi:Family of unknown function (DUF5681)
MPATPVRFSVGSGEPRSICPVRVAAGSIAVRLLTFDITGRLRLAAGRRLDGSVMTENTVPNLEHRFQKGQSGNPAGKPRGARHKATIFAERLMQDDIEKIVGAVLTAARNGDMMAAKIVLDRLAPVSRRQCVSFDLPQDRDLGRRSGGTRGGVGLGRGWRFDARRGRGNL